MRNQDFVLALLMITAIVFIVAGIIPITTTSYHLDKAKTVCADTGIYKINSFRVFGVDMVEVTCNDGKVERVK